MSLQGLISGSECAVPSNPLSQVLKHTEGDRSLQQDRVGGPSSSREVRQLKLQSRMYRWQGQFFGGPMAPSLALAPPVSHAELFRMPDVRDDATRAQWGSEFGGTLSPIIQGPSTQQPGQQILDAQRPYTNLNVPYNYSMPMYGSGQGKARDADFEAAFAQAAASLSISDVNSSARIVELESNSTVAEPASEDVKTNTDFSEVWQHSQESDAASKSENLPKWESEFNQLMTAQREELGQDYGGAMQNAWESGYGYDEFADTMDNNPNFDELGYPILPDYAFEQNNPFFQPSTSIRSPLAEAKALLERNGSLSEAALLLEAAIQAGELGEHGYEAWILLGETRNMDEREEQGMRALMEGVRRAEAAGADGAGMLSLAISFTNESYDRASYHMLWRWLHARFPTFPVHDDVEKAVRSHSTWDSHDRLTEVFLALARQQYDQGVVDPDVQVALGVLFTTKQSTIVRRIASRDYLLWNRFGSCLSNGNKPEEALGAYREALNLRPTYTRAVYNVGVACLNISAHKEAAEHFLSALEMQESTGDRQTSEQLWTTLRRTFLQMDRNDLAELAKPESRSNLNVFRQHGFDF
ncbi:TPR-like protein [Chiua virens]|nr:TPR-like protein [Chiua virens]